MLSIDRVGETGAEKLVITKYVTKKKLWTALETIVWNSDEPLNIWRIIHF